MKLIKTCFILLFYLLSAHVSAEQMEKLGNFEVHYIAFGSTFITPEIARAYKLERSKYNGLINISILDTTQRGKPSVKAKVTGFGKNLLGHKKDLNFKEIVEGDAVYYIAQIRYTNEEMFLFNIDIDTEKTDHKLTFSQKFYVD
ncbi:DUF4426 domain-containing protein [Flocculibacter collagenilyticus]|uniref:DUF4426 domain-containing protein n=1 Tax=Flocculibacter collagenilyticus TaxID=2744479 RepID=UPI0018F450EB|nr:DUF4426 domain-containing protein [Flocculibacter collagenilyticus]